MTAQLMPSILEITLLAFLLTVLTVSLAMITYEVMWVCLRFWARNAKPLSRRFLRRARNE